MNPRDSATIIASMLNLSHHIQNISDEELYSISCLILNELQRREDAMGEASASE